MDYNSLVGSKAVPGSIAAWMNNTLLDVHTILTEAQAFIYQTLRCREMIVSDATLAIAAGDVNATLPIGFLDPISVRDQHLNKMKARDLASIKTRRWLDADGNIVQSQPRLFAIAADTIEFDCAADDGAAGNYSLDYYGAPIALSPQHPTNFLTKRYPVLLRKACQLQGSDFLNDDARVNRYQAQVMALIADIAANDELALRGAVFDLDFTESHV